MSDALTWASYRPSHSDGGERFRQAFPDLDWATMTYRQALKHCCYRQVRRGWDTFLTYSEGKQHKLYTTWGDTNFYSTVASARLWRMTACGMEVVLEWPDGADVDHMEWVSICGPVSNLRPESDFL